MKNIIKWLKEKRLMIPVLPSLVFIVLCSFIITYFVIRVSPGIIQDFTETAKEYTMLYLLNYVPVLFLLLLLFLLLNNAILSVSITSVLFIALGMINRVKIEMRQDPLVPGDVSLITEITSLLDKFNESFIMAVVGGVILSILILILAAVFFSTKPMKHSLRILGILTIIIGGNVTNAVFYQDDRLYDAFPVEGNYYFKVNHYVSKGFVYSFLHDYNTMQVKKPEHYSSSYFSSQKSAPDIPVNMEKPHIIMVMGEAFTDLSQHDAIDFAGYQDPLINYKRIIQESNTISGHIIVPNFGGGTADTEFDVLTGCSTTLIDNDLASYSFIKKTFDGIPYELKQLGYTALAIHPGFDWFYNRANVYQEMGFEYFYHLEQDFDLKKDGIAGYISDKAATEKIISVFEEHIKTSDNPLFEFCVTIQNHGPFTDKYGIKESFHTGQPATKEQINMLSNYFVGVADADQQIADLTDYFRDYEEPVILVYFGDHLPGFPSGLDLFKTLGYPIDIDGTVEERLNVYKTPFFIWQNNRAKDLYPFEEKRHEIGLPETAIEINASYLGISVLDLAGLQDLTAFFQFNAEARKILPVISPNGYKNAENQPIETLTPEQTTLVEEYKGWCYYKLFDEDIH